MARVGDEFPLLWQNCDGNIRLIAFITEPRPVRKILSHLGEPLQPPPVSPARGPPTDSGELAEAYDDRGIFQTPPDELPMIDIHSLWGPTQPVVRWPDFGKACADGEKLLAQRQFGRSFEVTAQLDVPWTAPPFAQSAVR